MADLTSCPKCGALVPENAPVGICPACLLDAGLASAPESPAGATGARPAAGFVPPAPRDLARHFPQLEILDFLGKGGMGAVYRARQPGLDRLVAVKILPPEVAADAAFAERFTREARALAKLSHQNIVSVYDFGLADGQYYFVMEFVDGANLRQLIKTGRLQPQEALAIIPQICDALQFAHDQGIVHRDIKPENILLDQKGRVKIADFGLAKLLDQAPDQHTLTGTRQAMGTLHYMAPEQMRGAGAVDHRADIYSLGVVFYEMLTGQLPIGRFEPPSKKVRVDVRLDDVVLRALESEPEHRYQRAGEIQTDVESISSSPWVDAEQKPAVRSPDRHDARAGKFAPAPRFSRKAIIGLCGAPFFCAVLLAFFSVSTDLESPVPAQRTSRLENGARQPANSERAAVPSTEVTSPGPRSHRVAWLQLALAATVLPLGLAAPFGTTVLGALAANDIRHSQGRLTGMPLAVADALLFPLLLLDGLIVVLCWWICVVGHDLVAAGAPMDERAWRLCAGITLVISLVACAYVDFRIARAAWRYVTRPIVPPRYYA